MENQNLESTVEVLTDSNFKQQIDGSFFKIHFKYFKCLDCSLYIILVAIVVLGLCDPIFNVINGLILNKVSGNTKDETVDTGGVMFMSLIYVFMGSAQLIATTIVICFGTIYYEKMTDEFKLEYFLLVITQNQEFCDRIDFNSFKQNFISQTTIISQSLTIKLLNMLTVLINIIFSYVVSFMISWKLTLALLSIVPIMVIGGYFNGIYSERSKESARKFYEQAGNAAEDVFTNIKTIFSFGNFEYETARYKSLVDSCYTHSNKSSIPFALFTGLLSFIYLLGFSLTIWIGVNFIEDHNLNYFTNDTLQNGDIATVFYLVIFSSYSVSLVIPTIGYILSAREASKDYFKILKIKQDSEKIPKASKLDCDAAKHKLTNAKGGIEFKDVCFAYPISPEKKIFDNFSIKFEEGKTTAIVGTSGSGKSTLVSLIEQLYPILGGSIMLDGESIYSFNLEDYREIIGFVPQEPGLIDTTIQENIMLGRTVSHNDFVEALVQSGVINFLNCFENGIKTIVGPGGSKLSGGQKQRVAIARALLAKPKILILDEATSALDYESEQLFQQFLENNESSLTIIVIAHRLTTIVNADLIYLLKEGRIAESGSHEDLMFLNGEYASLYKAQNQKQSDSKRKRTIPVKIEFYDMISNHEEKSFAQDEKMNNNPAVSNCVLPTDRELLTPIKGYKKSRAKALSVEYKISSTKQVIKKKKTTKLIPKSKKSSSKLVGYIGTPGKLSFRLSKIQTSPLTISKGFDRSFLGSGFKSSNLQGLPSLSLAEGEESLEKKEPSVEKQSRIFLWSIFLQMKCLFFFSVLIGLITSFQYCLCGYLITMAVFSISLIQEELVSSRNTYGIIFLFYGIFYATCETLTSYLFSMLSNKITLFLRKELFEKYLSFNVQYFEDEKYSSSLLLSRLSSDTLKINTIITSIINYIIRTMGGIIISMIITCIYCWQICLCSMALIPIFVYVSHLLIQAQNKITMTRCEHEEDHNNFITECLNNIKILTYFNSQVCAHHILRKKILSFHRDKLVYFKLGLFSGLNILLSNSFFALFIFLGTYFYTNYGVSYLNIIVCQQMIYLIIYNIGEINYLIADYKDGQISLEEIYKVLHTTNKENESNSNDQTSKVQVITPLLILEKVKMIEFIEVSFTYPNRNEPVLNKLNFVANYGETIGFVGPSGSGKSTILQLLLRFYEPSSGLIQVNGVDISKYEINSYRKAFGIVLQEPKIFRTSVSENIKYGNLQASAELVEQYAQQLKINHLIKKDDALAAMSGGEKQRICLARCIIKNPSVIILDEATSALDNESEEIVQKIIKDNSKGKIVILIAHKLNTTISANLIYYIRKGEVIEYGNHEDLMSMGRNYFDLFSSVDI